MFWVSGNRLLPYGNRLPESKNSGKRFFFEKFFWTKCAIQSLKKIIYTYFDAFLEALAYLESFLDSSLESWFLIEWLFDSWNLLESWFLIEWLFDSWNLLESWFLTWVFGIIKISLEALLPHKQLVFFLSRKARSKVKSSIQISKNAFNSR